MGWTHCYKPTTQSPKDFLAKDSGCLTWSGLPEGAHPEIVGSATGGKMIAFAVRFPAAFYQASRSQPPGYYVPAADGSITAAICFMTSSGEGPKSECYNFGYKDMSETMGPCEHVSASILPFLSPLNPENDSGSVESARQWREGCKAYSATRSAMSKTKNALRDGAKIILPEPLKFSGANVTDAFEAQTFIAVRSHRPGKKRFHFRSENGLFCKLTARHLAQATIS